MDVNVKVTIDLGDKTMSLFGDLMAANNAVANAADTAGKVLAKYADESEPDKPARARRSRKVADGAPERPRHAETEPDNEHEDDNNARPEPAPRAERPGSVTHDDIRDLMANVIEADEDNRPKVLKQLGKIGAKSVGTIKDEDLADFFEFLQSLKEV